MTTTVRGRARTYDPETSKRAARNAKANRWCKRVYDKLLEYGERGAIQPVIYDHFAKEYMANTGKRLTSSSVGGRFSDLFYLGMARKTGKRRPNPHHVGDKKSMCEVWVALSPPFIPPDEGELNPLARANLRHEKAMSELRGRFDDLKLDLKQITEESASWETKARIRLAKLKQYREKFGNLK